MMILTIILRVYDLYNYYFQEYRRCHQEMEEVQSKAIQDKITEINSKDSMTLTDQAEKERLEEELETLKQIKQVQEDIANSKKSETLQDIHQSRN